MAKHVKRSAIPIYLIGVTWLIYGGVFSLRSVPDFLMCAGLSAAAFVVGKALFPDKEFTVAGEPEEKSAPEPEKKREKPPEPKKSESTGNPAVDALVKERDRALSEMRRLNDNIADEKISAQIDHLEEVTGKIVDQVMAKPEKLPMLRRFLDYYLPTTLKILNAYDRMDATGISGTNIDSTKEKVEQMMDTITLAFDRQLDALFGEEALDISTDITVMENLLAREGLGGMNINGGAEETEKRKEPPENDSGITLEL